MFSADPFAQPEYAFKARSSKIKPQPGKPIMPHRWIKAKFGRKAWIGKSYWFNMDQADGWEYAGIAGQEEVANGIVVMADFKTAWAETEADKQQIIEAAKKELADTLDRADNIDTEGGYHETVRYERQERLQRIRR